MADDNYSLQDMANAIKGGDGRYAFFVGRIKMMREAKLLPVVERTPGGQARYSKHGLVCAAIYSELLELGLSHSRSIDDSETSLSPFLATRAVLLPLKLEALIEGVANGESWTLQIDMIRGQGAARTFKAKLLEPDSEMVVPKGSTALVLLTLKPLIKHIVGMA